MATIVVALGKSTYNGIPVYDQSIADLVGLETYKALWEDAPNLYKTLNYSMAPQDYYSQIVDNSMGGETTAVQLKTELIRLVVTGQSNHNGATSLIKSSYVVQNYASSSIEMTIYYIIITLWIAIVVWFLVQSGLLEYLLVI